MASVRACGGYRELKALAVTAGRVGRRYGMVGVGEVGRCYVDVHAVDAYAPASGTGP